MSEAPSGSQILFVFGPLKAITSGRVCALAIPAALLSQYAANVQSSRDLLCLRTSAGENRQRQ